jgi:predicted oxidoreductase
VPAQTLRRTLDEYNDDAQRGQDSKFGKGSTKYNRHLGDPLHKPNPCLAPIERAPYYAIQVHAGDIGTTHGIAVDEYSRALDTDGAPIPGLYIGGNDRSSIMGGCYPSGGITVGPALTFAYLAMRHAAGLETADAPVGDGLESQNRISDRHARSEIN